MIKYIIFVTFCIFVSCDANTNDSNRNMYYPASFPLEVGNAWIYNRINYENNTESLDTLYIVGQYEDFFLYSWRPDELALLVKNDSGVFANYGFIDYSKPDTILYSKPSAWFIYDNRGLLNKSDYGEYHVTADSIITFRETYIHNGLELNSIKEVEYRTRVYDIQHTYMGNIGYLSWRDYKIANDTILIKETKLISAHKNIFPPKRKKTSFN